MNVNVDSSKRCRLFGIFKLLHTYLCILGLTSMSELLVTLKAKSRQHDLAEIDKGRPLRCIRKSYMRGLPRSKHQVL